MTLESMQELARTEHLVLLIQQDSDSHFSFRYQLPDDNDTDLYSPTTTIESNKKLQKAELFGDKMVFQILNQLIDGLTEQEVIELHSQALRSLSRMFLSERPAH